MIIYFSYEELKMKSESCVPAEWAAKLGFEEAFVLARKMLFNIVGDDSLREYAVEVLEAIRQKYPDQWNSSWKYDAFLGYAYNITLDYDKRYFYYKSAFDKVHPCPPELLVALSGCYATPGKPPITEEEAIALVKQAIQSTLYIEAVARLRTLYDSIGDVKEQHYWEQVLETIKYNGTHLPSMEELF
jgi:hypothetical protein